MTRRFALALLLILSACRAQPESVANRFDRTQAQIENQARALESETENQVRAVEAEMDAQGNAFVANQLNATMPAENLTNAAVPAANAAPRARR